MESKAEMALAEARLIDVGDGWFEVVALPNDIFALTENGHIQEVSSFLIVGSNNALLFDTGMGISDISAVVQQLTDLEIIVVNSHTHFDHIGDDWRFPAIHVYADDYAVNVLTEGYSHWDVRYDSDPDLFSKAYPPGFDPEKYSIRPTVCFSDCFGTHPTGRTLFIWFDAFTQLRRDIARLCVGSRFA